ncbi:hypothetical protein MANES_15G175912v8 [Manihot esculenta]|uniref:Uncharacterized protein n=1 Tax=Manihot esculenta TaxID=3983 RepID=A0ACB7GC97_MANES|nr:hypothetical protein MANES_15G175912v8 [Manihot esculenta]
MASSSTINVTHAAGHSLVSINSTQFPLNFTATNYPTWRAQVSPLLKGYSLMGYILEGKQVSNSDYEYWKCQDQLILVALQSSLSFYVMNVVADAETSELSLCGSPVSDVDLVVQVLEGIGHEFYDITAIHVRDTVISFDEFQDKLLAHDLYLKQIDPSYEVAPITANHV